MYKFSLFTQWLMTPEGEVFEPKYGDAKYNAYLDWVALGNTAEQVESFPGEIEAYERRMAIQQEVYKYTDRAIAGTNFYYEIMAGLRYDVQHQVITQSDFEAMQIALVETRNELITGQWDLALVKLQQTSLGQELEDLYYDGMEQRIIMYISQNYGEVNYSREEDEIGGGGIKNPKP